MGYRSNYLGQLEKIRYPDGEEVRYEYNGGGQVRKVTGAYEGLGAVFTYVENIEYDEFGQRVYMKYGNGVETRYRYDEKRRWLERVETIGKEGEVIQDIKYEFDYVGNVKGYRNRSGKGKMIRKPLFSSRSST